MNSSTEIRWLLVGAGDIARKRVAPAIASIANSRLVGVCDKDPDCAAQLAAQYEGVETFTDLDQALKHSPANAVYLATPVFLHVPQLIQALDSGRHVLVEKPLGLNGPDAQKAAVAADRSNLRAGCAYFRRCSPRYRHLADMIQNNELGRLVLVRMTYFSWFNPSPEDPKYWRVDPARGGGGPLSDMGTHMFDVLIGLVGMPRKVFAKAHTLVHPYQVEDSSVMLMELENGADVVASFQWNTKTWAHEFEVIGTEAKVKWFPYDAGPVVRTVGRDIAELDLPNADNVHAPLIEDFVAAIREGRPPLIPIEEAAKTNLLLDAVYESARTGREVVLAED